MGGLGKVGESTDRATVVNGPVRVVVVPILGLPLPTQDGRRGRPWQVCARCVVDFIATEIRDGVSEIGGSPLQRSGTAGWLSLSDRLRRRRLWNLWVREDSTDGVRRISTGDGGISVRRRFDGEWETVRLVELGTTYGGLAGKSSADFGSGNARYISFLDVLDEVTFRPRRFDKVRVASSESQNRDALGDVLFNSTPEPSSPTWTPRSPPWNNASTRPARSSRA